MKKQLSILMILVASLGVAFATHWTYNKYSYDNETVIYADLVTNEDGYTASDYEVAAFIDGVCRYTTETPSLLDNTYYFLLEAWGDANDANKVIEFRAYNKQTGMEYELTPSEEIKYDGESHIAPTQRITLTLTAPTSVTIESFDVNVDETVSLLDHITIQPEGATLPLNHTWNLGNDVAFATIIGDSVKGVSPRNNVSLYLYAGENQTRLAYGRFNVVSHATAIDIVTEEFTVTKGDQETLTSFMTNNYWNAQQVQLKAYELTPTTATEEVFWELKDDGKISLQASAWGDDRSYNPVATGTTQIRPYVMLDNGTILYPADNKWITVNIVQPVESIDIAVEEITCNVGDDITNRLNNLITVQPTDASNPAVVWESENSDFVAVQEDGNIVALRALGPDDEPVSMYVTSVENPDIQQVIRVFIQNPAKDVRLNKTSLTLTLDLEADYTDEVMACIDGLQPEDYTTVQGEIELEGSSVTYEDATIDSEVLISGLKTVATGKSTLRFTVYWTEWTDDNDEVSYSSIVTLDINVVEGEKSLEGFTVETSDFVRWNEGTITLTPQPEDATFDPSLVTVEVANWALPDNWTFGTVDVVDNGDGALKFTFTPEVPGYGSITVYYNGERVGDPVDIIVGAELQLQSGWQWKTIYWGNANAENMEAALGGDALIEARTQEDLLYNDPQLGYYGTLMDADKGITQDLCFSVKMKEANTSALSNGYFTEAVNVQLHKGWTWIPSPFYYNRALSHLTEAGNTFTEGDRITSKEDGFAEWNGTEWVGTLQYLKAGEGYHYYNAGEDGIWMQFPYELQYEQADENPSAGNAPVLGDRTWQYDASQFMNNMSLVATIDGLDLPDHYSVGVFVGDECRGEGKCVDGKFFITGHGSTGDVFTFKLYDMTLGQYFDIVGQVKMSSRVGSLKAPYTLEKGAAISGIGDVTAAGTDRSESYNLSGVRQQQMQRGVNLVRMSDGTVRKVMQK